MKTSRMAFAVLVACAALTGCGGQGGDGAAGPSPTATGPASSPAASGTPSAPPTTALPPAPPASSIPPPGGAKPPPGGPRLPPGPGATELTGTVESGVEPGCLLLDGHQLIGGPRDVLAVGARVSVTGRAQPDLVSTCQQGIPFVVESARRS
ncbi:hypothetical protein [Micromonospora sp. NPDC092111]|uniref:hypothetical protein n=1 Tax=Micromonospora sp. NPDC092111 TaxID=3364289 RepID=UPI00380DF1DD